MEMIETNITARKLRKYVVTATPICYPDTLEWEIHATNEEEAYDDGEGLAIDQGDCNLQYDIEVYEIEDD